MSAIDSDEMERLREKRRVLIAKKTPMKASSKPEDLRAPSEDDDGYDPYSDRPAAPEPLFERDPWA